MSQDLKQALFGVFDAVQKNAIKLDFGADPEPGEAGQSRLGGRPDVPRDFEWPRFQDKDDDSADANRPLTFLAQVNLADATRYDTEGLLPTAGVRASSTRWRPRNGALIPGTRAPPGSSSSRTRRRCGPHRCLTTWTTGSPTARPSHTGTWWTCRPGWASPSSPRKCVGRTRCPCP
ncbi:Putative uncharacterized protein [Propionibacterium freudenreichii]|nr:Putative uncharacterized protein [Propionibacterium freudenreichii]CEI49071.1 Putative uncharacterized protein [Propionibacterium freudenreichii]